MTLFNVLLSIHSKNKLFDFLKKKMRVLVKDLEDLINLFLRYILI